jgi:hypothetical protein
MEKGLSIKRPEPLVKPKGRVKWVHEQIHEISVWRPFLHWLLSREPSIYTNRWNAGSASGDRQYVLRHLTAALYNPQVPLAVFEQVLLGVIQRIYAVYLLSILPQRDPPKTEAQTDSYYVWNRNPRPDISSPRVLRKIAALVTHCSVPLATRGLRQSMEPSQLFALFDELWLQGYFARNSLRTLVFLSRSAYFGGNHTAQMLKQHSRLYALLLNKVNTIHPLALKILEFGLQTQDRLLSPAPVFPWHKENEHQPPRKRELRSHHPKAAVLKASCRRIKRCTCACCKGIEKMCVHEPWCFCSHAVYSTSPQAKYTLPRLNIHSSS